MGHQHIIDYTKEERLLFCRYVNEVFHRSVSRSQSIANSSSCERQQKLAATKEMLELLLQRLTSLKEKP